MVRQIEAIFAEEVHWRGLPLERVGEQSPAMLRGLVDIPTLELLRRPCLKA